MHASLALFQEAAGASRDELVRCIQYLKTENDILRSRLPKRIPVTGGEKRRLGLSAGELGTRWRRLLISIAAPATVDRWRHRPTPGGAKTKNGPGRPRAPERIKAIVLRLASENGWGVTRIYGELRKLGLAGSISRTTVRNLLRANGFDPDAGTGSWNDFLKRHPETRWATDFLTKPVVTAQGKQDAYLLIFKNLGSKRVWISPPTFYPVTDWVTQQARNFIMSLGDHGETCRYLIHDRDTKYSATFKQVIASEDIEAVRIAYLVPEMNGHAESFIGTLKHECLDHFVVESLESLDRLCVAYAGFYNTVRPHRALGNQPIACEAMTPPPNFSVSDVASQSWLDGMLNHYTWRNVA
ncbi:MAG: transposase [Planctomycetes bacterium]|nr:transposase [Planctomycetota bacterium]